MRRALAALGGILTAVALVVACGSDPAHVTGKGHVAGHTAYSTVTKTKRVCTTSSKRSGKKTSSKRTCSRIPVSSKRVRHWVPGCWELRLDTGGHVCVSASKWLKTDIGDRY